MTQPAFAGLRAKCNEFAAEGQRLIDLERDHLGGEAVAFIQTYLGELERDFDEAISLGVAEGVVGLITGEMQDLITELRRRVKRSEAQMKRNNFDWT